MPLAKGPTTRTGQLWKIPDGYLQIVQRGKTLIHYKMMRNPDQRAVTTQVSGISEVEDYLKTTGAKLFTPAAKRDKVRQIRGAR